MKLNFDVRGIGKKITKIPKLYKIIFILVFNILIFASLFYFVVLPQIEIKKKLLTEYEGLKLNLDKMAAIRSNMGKFQQEYAQLQEVLKKALKQLPETKDVPNLLRNVSKTGAETRIKIKYFEPKAIQNKEFYAELPFEIRYSGPFHNIGYFFDGVRKLERIINISSFVITHDAKGVSPRTVLEGACLAKTYVYLPK